MAINLNKGYEELFQLWSQKLNPNLRLVAYSASGSASAPERMSIVDPESDTEIIGFEAFGQEKPPLSISDSLPHTSEYKDRYCLEYAIALLTDHVRKGHVGVTIEVGFGDKNDQAVLIHAIVHTLGEDDSTGGHSRGWLQNLCVRWRDAERSEGNKVDGYSIESFCDAEAVRERAFALGIPIDQFAVMTALLEVKKQG